MNNLYDGKTIKELPLFSRNEKLNDPTLYKPTKALVDAVQIALILGKPLLLTGEPGTGKTQLAHHLAHFLDLDKPLIYNTRTSSVANDLFYTYDALQHFQYSHNAGSHVLSHDEIEQKFIRYQALGEAIQSKKRQVVLIDEIDKAPRDFPNDILNNLEELSFIVPEINKEYHIDERYTPVIIFTSNSEKNLPEPFLRRCVYFNIEFPDQNELLEIISNKLDSALYGNTDILNVLIPHFTWLREQSLRKKPSTAEFILWVTYLEHAKLKISVIEEIENKRKADKKNNEKIDLDPNLIQAVKSSYNILLKNKEDVDNVMKQLDFLSLQKKQDLPK